MKFTYSSGHRPLDGYTIKRGVGHGGFGEVYFAISDGGKEVALKMIRNNLEVELRGMKQCLNFKHTNLVQLYDIREDAVGNHWVIMEYVSGESLNNILARHSQGMDIELAQQWFDGLASAVTYLHDHGVVHRDLKPGNIFIENGAVKVGDYGLCKCVSGSQRSAQTQSVGTVHYMAPEISTGNYNKQIDVYAAGIVLYEMLTGRVPFEGESVGEILMKHLTTPPDLSLLPKQFVPILSKALSKNPAHRHRTMAELAKDVKLVGRPQKIPAAIPVPSRRTKPLYVAKQIPIPEPELPKAQAVVVPLRSRLLELSQSMLLTVLLVGLFTVLWAAVLRTNDLAVMGRYFFLGLIGTWAVLIPSKLWAKRMKESLSRRVALMCLGLGIGALAIWLDGHDLSLLFTERANAEEVQIIQKEVARENDRDGCPLFANMTSPSASLPVMACYLSYFGLAFFGIRWWQLADRRRSRRFSFFSVVAVGVLGFVLMFVWALMGEQSGGNPGPGAAGLVVVVMIAVVVQLVSPWQKSSKTKCRKLRLPRA